MKLKKPDESPFLMMGIEFVIAVAIALFFVSMAMNNFVALPAQAAMLILTLLCLPLLAIIYWSEDDALLKQVVAGLLAFFLIEVISGCISNVLPQIGFFSFLGQFPALQSWAMLLMPLAYLPLLAVLASTTRSQKPGRSTFWYLITLTCVAVIFVVTGFLGLSVLGKPEYLFPALIAGSAMVGDVLIAGACAILLAANVRRVGRYLFGIILVSFFLSFLGDTLSAFMGLQIYDVSNSAMIAYSVMMAFVTLALLLYSMGSVNRLLVDRMNRELYDTRRLVDDLLLCIPDAMCVADVSGTVVRANRQFCQIAGTTLPETVGSFNLFRDIGKISRYLCEDAGRMKAGAAVTVNRVSAGSEGRLYRVKLFPTFSAAGTVSSYMILMEDVTEIELATDALKKSEALYRGVVQDQTELISRYTAEGICTFVNDAYCDFFRCGREEALGGSMLTMLSPEDRLDVKTMLGSLTPEDPQQMLELEVDFPGEGSRWLQWAFRAIFDADGRFIEIQSVARDITRLKEATDALRRAHDELEVRVQKRTMELATANAALRKEIEERKAAEEKIRASLAEKDVLLKEVHHRVKNNLQIVISLLNMQVPRLNDPADVLIYEESQNRIRSIALAHDNLYQSDNLSEVDFGRYADVLIRNLCQGTFGSCDAVDLAVDIPELKIDVNKAIPCGLIINELVGAALKAPARASQKREIRLALHPASPGKLALEVRVRHLLQPEVLYGGGSPSCDLVEVLVSQLEGCLRVDHGDGIGYTVTFGA